MWIRASVVRFQSSVVATTTTTTSVSNGPRIITPAARAALLSLQSLNRRRLLFHRTGFGDPVELNNTRFAANGSTRKPAVKSLVPHHHLIRRGSKKLTNHNNNHNSTSTSLSTASTSTSHDNDNTDEKDKNKFNGYESDLVVVLDMDECLLHSQFLGGEEDDQYRQYEEERNTMESESVLPSNNGCESFRVALDNDDQEYVNVNCRPHLHEFLRQVTKRYETHIFTAAMEVYARPVLQHIDPDGTYFAHRIHYRESCILDDEWGVYVKNLSHILPNINPARTVLVDNNPFSFLSHPSNGILVSNFYNDPKDDTLQAVYELLQDLEDVPDVRPILDNRFRLADTLEQVINPNESEDDQNSTNGPNW